MSETDLGDDTADDPNRVPAATAREVCEYLVRSLVRDPDAVRVEVVEGHRKGPRLDVYVAQGDMGRVIGKRCRNLNEENAMSVVYGYTVANDVTAAGSGFGTETNQVTIFHDDGRVDALPLMSKYAVAHAILDAIAARLG